MLRRSLQRALGALQPLRHELQSAASLQVHSAQAVRRLPQQQADVQLQLQQWRRWMSQQAGSSGSGAKGPRSMLDAEFASSGSHQVLGQAAEMRMQQLQHEAAPAAAPGALSRVRRFVGDVLFYGGLATVCAAGYVYYKYPNQEVERWLQDSQKEAKEGSLASAAAAWLVDKYLEGAHFVEHKVREYADPPCDKLLPDMDPQWSHIKTLVLDLEDVLVHKEWSRAKGWQIYRRPGAREFIAQLGQYYELVIYTDETSQYADPIITALDATKVVPYRLYRQDTQYVNGKHVRDLSKLNRQMGHVLFISANPDAYSFQPENTLKLKPWLPEKQGEPKDTTLLDLIPFMQMVAERVPDVRDVVKAYDGEEDVARAFKERMAHVAHQHPPRRPGLLGKGAH